MLTSHGMDYASPLTILLIGQPTLRRRLRVGDMAALDQRIQLRYHIPALALTPGEAEGYLRAHLALAGRTDTLFSDDAVRAIHGHARGMPAPSTGWQSPPCSPPTPPARPSPTHPRPAPPSPRRPRQTDHHHDTPATPTRPAPRPAGFPPCRRIATVNVTFMDTVNGREQQLAADQTTPAQPRICPRKPGSHVPECPC